MIGVVALGVVVIAWLAVTHALMGSQADIDLSRSKSTADNRYHVKIAPEAEPLAVGAMHGWVLTLTTPDGRPVEEARIAISGGMPLHGHGLPTAPEVTAYLGEGRYRIEGVRFNMGGNWELEFAISAPPGDDNVAFNVAL
jgi:hypothetical protein